MYYTTLQHQKWQKFALTEIHNLWIEYKNQRVGDKLEKHTCPYAKTELLNPARQFSTRGAPTSWNISSCKTTNEKHLNMLFFLHFDKMKFSFSSESINIMLACLRWLGICHRVKCKSMSCYWQRIVGEFLNSHVSIFLVVGRWPHSHYNLVFMNTEFTIISSKS